MPALENDHVILVDASDRPTGTMGKLEAHRRGALFANPCFTQIHPTCIPVSGEDQSKLTLMSESLRNDGRVWVPKNPGDKRSPEQIPESERDYYLERKYPSFGNLVPRDIASRSAKEVCDEGRGVGPNKDHVLLDLRHIGAGDFPNRETVLGLAQLLFQNTDIVLAQIDNRGVTQHIHIDGCRINQCLHFRIGKIGAFRNHTAFCRLYRRLDLAGLVRHAEQAHHPQRGVDEEDGAGVVKRVFAVGAGHFRADHAERATQRIERCFAAGGGQYAAYGQKLDIERGDITFTGPYDNPSLDMLAVRPNLDVRVGVRVGGTALAPRVSLYSEPEMADTDKLAWLLLGQSIAPVQVLGALIVVTTVIALGLRKQAS